MLEKEYMFDTLSLKSMETMCERIINEYNASNITYTYCIYTYYILKEEWFLMII